MWYDPDQAYLVKHGHTCMVCRARTRTWVAPMGIVSGRIPCCLGHSDEEIKNGWSEWLLEQAPEYLQLPLE